MNSAYSSSSISPSPLDGFCLPFAAFRQRLGTALSSSSGMTGSSSHPLSLRISSSHSASSSPVMPPAPRARDPNSLHPPARSSSSSEPSLAFHDLASCSARSARSASKRLCPKRASALGKRASSTLLRDEEERSSCRRSRFSRLRLRLSRRSRSSSSSSDKGGDLLRRLEDSPSERWDRPSSRSERGVLRCSLEGRELDEDEASGRRTSSEDDMRLAYLK